VVRPDAVASECVASTARSALQTPPEEGDDPPQSVDPQKERGRVLCHYLQGELNRIQGLPRR